MSVAPSSPQAAGGTQQAAGVNGTSTGGAIPTVLDRNPEVLIGG